MSSIHSTTWRTLAHGSSTKELPKGLDVAWDVSAGVLGRLVPRTQRFLQRAKIVLSHDKLYTQMTDAALRDAAQEFKELFRCGRDTPEDLLRAFAAIREVAFRQIGEKPYLVQVAGALALEAGYICEMATGEGKTLTATMPATVGGWRGKGCHVVTVNDYLAKRDTQWMGRIYNFCHLTTAHIEQEMKNPDRHHAYHSDITYCTNKEVTADYLRDKLALGRLKDLPSALLIKITQGVGSGTDRLVQRGLEYAIIDEADSVLIDEAVTPLIISGDAPNEEQVQTFREAVQIGSQLTSPQHYKTNDRYREIDLTEEGKRKLEEITETMGGIWAGARRREELVTQAVTARHYYMRDKQYVIGKDKEEKEKDVIVIVDEFTGRLMPDRTWRDGLHQAIEAKEGITVNPPKDTFARMSFQRFFRGYHKLSGMTGTAAEGWPEFWQIYHRHIVVIPTNRPCIRKKLPDRVFAGEKAKWKCIVEDIASINKTGRPILVGTRSVRASEHLSGLLMAKGLEHQVLNAVRHAEEAQIVAGAGQPGRIIVATNMAGRGTDIKLGRGVAQLGGLHVIATERHESGRVDRQLFGRAARQGDPGSAQAIVSLEDELPVRHMPHLAAILKKRHSHSDQEIDTYLVRKLMDMAQDRAEKQALRQRKGVLRTDDWLDDYLGFAGKE
jgi:preprotein translocase subunit SecA